MNSLPTKFFCLLSLASMLPGLSARADDWYRWRGPDLNGISKETGWQSQWPAEGPKQLWKASVGMGVSSIVVSQGRAYTTGNNGSDTDTFYCLDAVTGAEIWKYSYPCDLDPKFYQGGTTATPTVDGDRVYSVSKKGDFFCFDAAKGTVIWSKSIIKDYGIEPNTWGFSSSPFIVGDVLYLNAGKAGTAFNKKNGSIIWTSEKGPSGYSNLLPFKNGNDECLAFMAFDTVEAIRMADGKSVWSYPWKTDNDINAGDPIVADGKMFFGAGYNHGCTLIDISKDKPVAVWENKNICNKFNIPTLWKGYIYCSDEKRRGSLKCLDWNTGELKWTEPSFGQGGFTMADGKIIGLTEKGELLVAEASPTEFKSISRAQVLNAKCWTTPVLSNGRIYCRDTEGHIVCVDVSGK